LPDRHIFKAENGLAKDSSFQGFVGMEIFIHPHPRCIITSRIRVFIEGFISSLYAQVRSLSCSAKASGSLSKRSFWQNEPRQFRFLLSQNTPPITLFISLFHLLTNAIFLIAQEFCRGNNLQDRRGRTDSVGFLHTYEELVVDVILAHQDGKGDHALDDDINFPVGHQCEYSFYGAKYTVHFV